LKRRAYKIQMSVCPSVCLRFINNSYIDRSPFTYILYNAFIQKVKTIAELSQKNFNSYN
jgi:hypothetical protein